MGGHVCRIQHTLDDCWAAAATRIYGKESIAQAAESGNIALVCDHLLVDPECVDDGRDVFQPTPLLYSARKGHLHICQLLLQNSADVNAFDRDHLSTPLICSASHGDLQICRLLLQHDADVDAKCTAQRTPLIYSALHCHLEICQLLLQSGADVNAKDFRQGTSLIYSSHHGHLEICRALVDSKADAAARDGDGNTALKCAIDQNKADVVAYLRSIGATE
jgi:ankyrin repeat protein